MNHCNEFVIGGDFREPIIECHFDELAPLAQENRTRKTFNFPCFLGGRNLERSDPMQDANNVDHVIIGKS